MEAPNYNLNQRFKYLARLYFMYLKLYYRTLAEYRIDTWISLLSGLFVQLVTLLFINIIFQRIPSLSDWSFYEVLFIYSFASMGREFSRVFLNAPFSLHGFIRTQKLDIMLVRPAGPLFQVIASSQEINGIGLGFVAIGLMVYSAMNLTITWSILTILYLILALICSIVLQYAILMSVVTLGFWLFELRSIIYPVLWLYDFGYYPMSIYPFFMKFFLTFIVPYAFASFFPAAYILKPHEYYWALWAVPLVTILVTSAWYTFWRFGLKNYSSTSY